LKTTPSAIRTNVSTDCLNFAGNKYCQIFIDRYCGYVIGHFTLTTGDSKVLAECATKVIREYNLYKHEVQNISKDALSAYQTEFVGNSMAEEGATNTESIPYEHAQNYVERFIQIMAKMSVVS
jgi:hypothetical protein